MRRASKSRIDRPLSPESDIKMTPGHSGRPTPRVPRVPPTSRDEHDAVPKMKPGTTTGAERNSARSRWEGLRRHTHERDLKFISPPFSTKAVELLTPHQQIDTAVPTHSEGVAVALEVLCAKLLSAVVALGIANGKRLDGIEISCSSHPWPENPAQNWV